LSDKISNQEIASLNRQLSDANAAVIELRNEGRIRDSGVNVTNNINQNTMMQQQQQQIASLANATTLLLGEVQRNTQSVVNLGTMTGSNQTAANTRVNS